MVKANLVLGVSFFAALVFFQVPLTAYAQQAPIKTVEDDIEGKLVRLKRIYVESFGEDKQSKVLHAMVVNSLVASKRFIVTENRESADAVLKGSAIEKTSQELHASGDSTSVAAAAGGVSGSRTKTHSRVDGGFGALAAGIEDSEASTETIDRAAVAVRLVDANGDLLWATTQESKGAKYKGASADAADKVVKQLLRDVEKLEKK